MLADEVAQERSRPTARLRTHVARLSLLVLGRHGRSGGDDSIDDHAVRPAIWAHDAVDRHRPLDEVAVVVEANVTEDSTLDSRLEQRSRHR